MTTKVIIANPYKVATSGITVGTSPINISPSGMSPFRDGLNVNGIIIQNLGSADVYIHYKSTDVAIEGMEITAPSATNINILQFPFNAQTTLWAATATGTANIRMLFY